MLYEPFFNMNILMTAEALSQVKAIAFYMVLFHLLLIAYFLYRFIKPLKAYV